MNKMRDVRCKECVFLVGLECYRNPPGYHGHPFVVPQNDWCGELMIETSRKKVDGDRKEVYIHE